MRPRSDRFLAPDDFEPDAAAPDDPPRFHLEHLGIALMFGFVLGVPIGGLLSGGW